MIRFALGLAAGFLYGFYRGGVAAEREIEDRLASAPDGDLDLERL